MKLPNAIALQQDDVLIIVDVQRDFLPSGNLAVLGGDRVIPILNRYIKLFQLKGLPLIATRDWHPQDHCSFVDQGGPWPSHCVAGTEGALFPAELALPHEAIIISKAQHLDKDAYSGFEGTELAARLHQIGATRLFVGGLATDYCVLNTVKDALAQGFRVMLLQDGIRAVNVHPGDGTQAEREMARLGATLIDLATLGPQANADKWANKAVK